MPELIITILILFYQYNADNNECIFMKNEHLKTKLSTNMILFQLYYDAKIYITAISTIKDWCKSNFFGQFTVAQILNKM